METYPTTTFVLKLNFSSAVQSFIHRFEVGSQEKPAALAKSLFSKETRAWSFTRGAIAAPTSACRSVPRSFRRVSTRARVSTSISARWALRTPTPYERASEVRLLLVLAPASTPGQVICEWVQIHGSALGSDFHIS